MKKLFIVPVLCTLVCFSGCKQTTVEEKSIEHSVLKVEQSDVEIIESYTASITGRQDVEIYPQVSGTISLIMVQEGQRVKKGNVLFILDQIPYKADLETALADKEAAKSQVDIALLTYDSKKELFAEKVISEYDLLTAKSNLDIANAVYQQAEARVTNTRNSLSYTEIKSPCDGIIGTLPFRVGALVGPTITQPLTTVSDNSQMFAYFSMTENQLRRMIADYGTLEDALKNLPEIKLITSDGKTYPETGKVESISGIVNPQTGTVSVKSIFPNSNRMLFSGSIGNVEIPYTLKNAYVIPQSATYELQDKVFVYVVKENIANAVNVNIERLNDGKNYIVTNGLLNGDEIVLDGVGLLQDGAEMKVLQKK